MASLQSSGFDVAQLPDPSQRRKTNVLLLSSVALCFISFWRAAAIVLCDLASSAYYIGGISEQAIGKAAPWFILAVMLFSYCVRSVYVESCTMFTRGGVYRVVKQAMGGSLAKLSVSALMFDYILTGPISAVSAGAYLVGLFGNMLTLITSHTGNPIYFNANTHPMEVRILAMMIALLITVYFWRANIKGMHESSDKALKIMKATTLVGAIVIGWSLLTLALHPDKLKLPPFMPVFTDESEGWLRGFPKLVGALGILIAFGHSVLAMSGEESLAQVNREIEAPKLLNLRKAGFVIFVYSLLLTSLISFFAVLIIPDGQRVKTAIVPNGQDMKAGVTVDYIRKDPANGRLFGYSLDDAPEGGHGHMVYYDPAVSHIERDDGGYRDNLINGLANFVVGPAWVKLILQGMVVIVGFLILAGAVNTSIVGSNGVMNRLAEDGVLTPWFLHPHQKFGTSHRLINVIAILQIVTIIYSWGDVNTLGEAYAFGVIWSFVFNTLAMTVLRFKDKSPRQYEVPLNVRIGKEGSSRRIDIPIGIIMIFLVLLSTAALNLLTKKTATIWGFGFTAAFLVVFIVLERLSYRRHKGHHEHLEQFNEKTSDTVSSQTLGLEHPNPLIVAVRGPRSLPMLEKVLKETNTDERDVVVVTCKVLPPRTLGITREEQSIDEDDRELLTKVVTVAERVGKHVHPLVVPTNNALYAIACAARDIGATELVFGVSEQMHAETQLEQFALAWGSATPAGSSVPLSVRILGPNVEVRYGME